MSCITKDELKFLRLLERTKRLTKENLSANVWKVTAATKILNNMIYTLQDGEKTNDILQEYRQEVLQLKLLAEAESKSTAEESLKVIDRIPRVFPEVSKGSEDLESAAQIRVIQRSIYRSDLRKQLLSTTKKENSEDAAFMKNEKLEEDLANDLLKMTRSLKSVMSKAGDVIKEDNQRLIRMHKQIDDNKIALEVEGARVAHHAYKCGFDCMRVFLLAFVFITFIMMIIVTRIFPKRASY